MNSIKKYRLKLLLSFFILCCLTIFAFFFYEKINVLSAILLIIIGLILLIKIRSYFSNIKSITFLKIFNFDSETLDTNITRPVIFDTRDKIETMNLFIHGFSASTSEFQNLSKKFSERNIPHYIPTLSGFGVLDFNLIEKINFSDWLRDAQNSMNLVKSISSKVNIIGHSMGALVALYLSQYHEVENLILTSPYLTPKKNHKFYTKLLLQPLVGEVLSTLNPTIPKSSNREKEIFPNRFIYHSVPINAIKSLWQLQEVINYEKVKAIKISILVGEKDNTVKIEDLKKFLTSKKMNYEMFEYKNSGHNLLEEKEAEIVEKKIISIIE
ncbi:MAG: hypothetical protein C0425_01020 [Chlorobiaceae bacterium]|nr:hypothetical protein [Chlorobiaceae bacterium]MBA4308904.1 hypothetical protein [Chlorobiaceae bacterium]